MVWPPERGATGGAGGDDEAGAGEGAEVKRAIWAVATLTAASGVVVMVRMYETHPRHDRTPVPDDVDLES